MMSEWLLALYGGGLLGISVVGYLYFFGRIAGISGLISQILNPKTILKTPALWFILGLFIVPFLFKTQIHDAIQLNSSAITMIIAGVIVGIGTRLGSGCTSGHGICGISRLSKRSLVATTCFMATGILTVYVMRHLLGANT